ncbi:MAG: hypothetical protein HGA65_16165 [Oscillochloris sp.]|nr:hypothetical protein [Oscillochloris sp.]
MSNNEQNPLIGAGATLVGGTIRLGLTAISAPLIVLPAGTRRRVRNAVVEAARAIVAIPKEISVVSERVVEEVFSGAEPSLNLPSADKIGERARAFTDRLARAADEFGTSLGRAADRAVNEVERTAARVDEWVEKPKG